MIQLKLSHSTEQRLKQVMLLYQNTDAFFNKMIDYQISELKLGLHNIEKDLKEFEQKYEMTSKSFYSKFEIGEIDDQEDFMIWAGIYEMFLRDKQKINKLAW